MAGRRAGEAVAAAGWLRGAQVPLGPPPLPPRCLAAVRRGRARRRRRGPGGGGGAPSGSPSPSSVARPPTRARGQERGWKRRDGAEGSWGVDEVGREGCCREGERGARKEGVYGGGKEGRRKRRRRRTYGGNPRGDGDREGGARMGA